MDKVGDGEGSVLLAEAATEEGVCASGGDCVGAGGERNLLVEGVFVRCTFGEETSGVVATFDGDKAAKNKLN